MTASPNYTFIRAGTAESITDSSGNIWTISPAATVYRNGTALGSTSNVIKLGIVAGTIWHENATYSWRYWSGTSWSYVPNTVGPWPNLINNLPSANIMDYGAVNAGVSTPASALYTGSSALANLQAVYGTTIGGVTVALTQELDWLAYMLAYNVAVEAGGPGLIEMPAGAGYVFTNANSASDGSGMLPLPATTGWDFTGGVSIRGQFPGTILNWPYAPSNNEGILCGGRAAGAGGGSSGGNIEGVILVGPGGSTSMQGLLTNDRRNLKDVHTSKFMNGINVAGGQCKWENVLSHDNNKYDYYFDWNNTSNYGNMEWHFVRGLNAGLAVTGIHGNWYIPNVEFYGFGAFTSPWGIYKESGAVATSMTGCRFYGAPQFEGMGNGAVGDASGATPFHVVFDTCMENVEFSYDSTYKLAGSTAYAPFNIGQAFGFEIDGINTPTNFTPGTIAGFNITFPSNVTIRGDMNDVFTQFTTVPFLAGLWSSNPVTIEQTTWPNWKAKVITTSTVPAVGRVVSYTGSDNGAASTGSGDVVAGISVYAPPSGNLSIVATSGSVPVNIASGSATTGGRFVYPAASGNASETASGAPIGVMGDNYSGSSYWVTLRGLS